MGESEQHGGAVFREKPYRDSELLDRLYNEEKMTTAEIADELGCGQTTVRNWMERHGIERRSLSDAVRMGYGHHPNEVPLQTKRTGAVRWNYTYEDDKHTVFVHRLLAVAEYGFDAVRENVVHHKNEIRWDNRPSNIELMDHGEHSSHHKKVRGQERRRVADLYENTDKSSYDLAEEFGIAPPTVRFIHREVYAQ